MLQANTRRKGVGASRGIALGFVHVLDRGKARVIKKALEEKEVDAEIQRFESALAESRSELEAMKQKIDEDEGQAHAYLIEAQILMLDDKVVREGPADMIRDRRINAEWALHESIDTLKTMFDRIGDEYFRDRRSDIEYVEERLLRALSGKREPGYLSLQQKTVIVAHDLSPTDVSKLNRENLVGLATDAGGRTSHTAIIARSLGIPIVLGLGDLSREVQTGDRIIVDGTDGTVITSPDTETWNEYQGRQKKFLATRKELLKNRNVKAETKDQFEVRLYSNIDFLEELPSVVSNGAQGVGMMRTEHLFLGGSIPVSEEEQFLKYRKVVQKIPSQPTIIRLLDLSGDALFRHPGELEFDLSPAMGLRGMRLLLREESLLRTQLRAILRSSAFGKVAIMYPMISSVDEVRKANTILKEVMTELETEKVRFDPDIQVGALIEVPGAALVADSIARRVNFLAIGTNDLLQYTLAADRNSELVADVYEPLHPGFLRLLERLVKLAHKAGREIGICGEMAGEPIYVPILLALEVNYLSMTADSIPFVKQAIRNVSVEDCKSLFADVQKAGSLARMRDHLTEWYLKHIHRELT